MKTYTKPAMLDALRAFITQRSGMDGHNYGDRASYMQDYRRIVEYGRHARELLLYVELSGVPAAAIQSAARGRLTFRQRAGGSVTCDYRTGQYFPMEYRAAACRVLAGAVWRHWADSGMDAAAIRRSARCAFSRGVASAWFN